MHKGKCLVAFTVVVASVLLTADVGRAVVDPAANRCGAGKTKAAAKHAKVVFGCHARALRRGEALDPDCTAKAAERLAAGFAKAEAREGCATTSDEAGVQAEVDTAVGAVTSLLDPDPTPEALGCASEKVKASGRHIKSRLGCYSKTASRGLGPAAACLEQADRKLVAVFLRAERRGACTTTDDALAVGDLATAAVESLVRRVSPVCGDGLQGPAQECEDVEDAACPGLCDQDCLCDFPPVCGDGVAELPEQCDDANLDDGDGCSSSCQLEDLSGLCSGVEPTSGTSIDAILVSDEFTVPLYVTAPPLDPGRLFVVERRGYVRILDLADNSMKPDPFLDISDLTTTGGERGFFSMAFDPAYHSNGRFFVSYTNTSGDLVLARYEVDAGDPNLADPSTRQELLVVPHPSSANHNGGQVQFGGDGYLYWAMGDGGRGANAQDDTSMLGKMLRLDVAHDSAPFVSVPLTNPNFVDGTSDLEYVWAKGLRNPWRFSFDRLTGDLYIGDVGAGAREEISFAPGSSVGGENYGWRIFEGTRCNSEPCPDPPTGFTMPVHEIAHPRGCAVMGGYAYRGCAMPDLAGTYFFSDLCATFVQTFEIVAGEATNLTDRTDDARSAGAFFTGIVSWGEDARGEIYMVANNRIYRVEPE